MSDTPDAASAGPGHDGHLSLHDQGVILRKKPPRVYVRTFWFFTRIALRVVGTLVIPIVVFWLLVLMLGTDNSQDPFSKLALISWAIVSFIWAFIDSVRRPVVMNVITWLLVFLGVGAVMTLMGLAGAAELSTSTFATAAREAMGLVGPGSLVPAAIGVVLGTIVHAARASSARPAAAG